MRLYYQKAAAKKAQNFAFFALHSGIFSSFLSHATESFLTFWTPISPEPLVQFQNFFAWFVLRYIPKG